MAKVSSIDPLGIGIPQYARSTYDPVEFARRVWSEYAYKQVEPDKDKRREYTDWLKTIQTPEAFEASTAGLLGEEMLNIARDAERDVREGRFDPLAVNEQGVSLQQRVNEFNNRVNIYESLQGLYTRDFDTARDPSNREKIDKELTDRNFRAFLDEPDVHKKAEMILEPLVVFKPEQVEVLDEVAKAINDAIPGLDRKITRDSFDPKTGMIKIEYTEGISPERLTTGMKKAWNRLSERVQNELKRRYDNAPEHEKTAIEGDVKIPISLEDWFVAQYSPEYAKRMYIDYHRKPEDKTKISWGNILPQPNVAGELELVPSTKTFGVQVADEKGLKRTQVKEFNSEASIQLQGIFTKSFPMQVTRQTVDHATGIRVEQAQVVDNHPVSIEFAPIAPRTLTYTDKNGIQHLFEPGDIIPREIQLDMDMTEQGHLYKFEAFVITGVDYIRQPTVINIGDVQMPGRTKTYQQTNRMPFREAFPAMKAVAIAEEIDLKPLSDTVMRILNQLNRQTDKRDVIDIEDARKLLLP